MCVKGLVNTVKSAAECTSKGDLNCLKEAGESYANDMVEMAKDPGGVINDMVNNPEEIAVSRIWIKFDETISKLRLVLLNWLEKLNKKIHKRKRTALVENGEHLRCQILFIGSVRVIYRYK